MSDTRTIQQIKEALGQLMSEARTDVMVRETVRRALEPMISDAALKERIDRLILAGYGAERRRMFLQGAEWAKRYGDAEGFYTAAEVAAHDATATSSSRDPR